jgi:pimeloyl-ACP methyl ester carboxylesterase
MERIAPACPAARVERGVNAMSASDVVERAASVQKRQRPQVAHGGRPVIRDWRARLAVAVAIAAGAALVSTWLTPRGPVTTIEALASLVAAIAVGVLAGAVLGSRWSLLLTPAVFVVVFELTRLGVEGPTVDGIRLGSFVGLVSFVAGRGVHGLLVLVPMAIGARWGVELAARRGQASAVSPGRGGWLIMSLLSVAVLALGVVIARPASTAPILGADGQPLAGSIAELTTARIGGHDQALMIRGADVDNPVLLHLAGGPGGTDIGAMRLDTGLEQRFVVVTWDQRGAGKSYAALDPVDTLTLEQVVADTLEVTDYLRERFGQERIFLTGQSWGTIPSVLAVQRHPERYHAFVGTGQMVDIAETDRIFHDDTLAWAQRTNNDDLAATLQETGPPPYDDLADYALVGGYERDLNPYPEFDGHTEMPATIWAPENTLMDQVNAVRGLMDTYAVLYPQLQRFDFSTDVPNLDVPVYIVMGRHEARGRVEPARHWFDQLDAPVKEWVELPASSHRASFEQPAAYTELLTRVRDDALGR